MDKLLSAAFQKTSEMKISDLPVDMIFENSPFSIAIVDIKGKIKKSNISFNNLLQLNPSVNFYNNPFRSLTNYQNIHTTKEFVIEDVWNSAGKFIFTKETYQYIGNIDGIDNYLVYIEDITEFKKANRRYSILEEKHHIIFDQIPVGIYRIVSTGEILFANKKMAEILGYSNPDEIIGKLGSTFCLDPEENFKYINKQFDVLSPTYSIEYKIIRKNQEKIWIRDTANITYDNSNQVLFIDGIVEDITSRKNTESELDQLITAINQISEVIVITDLEGNIIYTNPAFEKMTLYSLHEVTGKNMNILKSGSQNKEVYKKLWKTILEGNSWTGNLINKKKNGELYEEHCVITPVRNIQGIIVSFVAIKRDITEEKKLENHLRNSQKLQAIGTLAGGIAHDFNNILMGMQVFTEILLKKLPKETMEHEIVEKIYTSQDRAKGLIKQILSFSRLSGDERESLQIHLVVKEALKLIKATLPATIKLDQKIEDCGFILANPTHIQQIVMNLCTNAHHAMEGEGHLFVELKKMDCVELPNGNTEKTGKCWIRLTVKDTGCGIEDKIKERIFEPFFTTKSVGNGTGLGLSTVHGIVKQYGGEIHFTTKIGTGTNFYIYLPACNN